MWKTVFVFVLLLPNNLFAGGLDFDVGVGFPNKEESVQFEPVVLAFWIINISDESQKIHDALDPRRQYLKFFITDSSGKTHVWQPPTTKKGEIGLMTLSAQRVGSAVHQRIVLSPVPGGWMDKPGTYQLSATYDYDPDAEEPLASTGATLTIKPAEGVNRKALEKFGGYPQSRFLANLTTAPGIADEFKAIIRDYPKSDYVPWCYYALGRAAQHQKSVPERIRAEEARKYYGLLLEKYPKFPMKVEVKYELARELFRLGKPDEAIREIEKLIEVNQDAANSNAELFLFYEVRHILKTFRDGNKKIRYEDLPSH